MHRFSAILLLAVTLLPGCTTYTAPVLSADDQRVVAQVQTYLNGLREFHTRFTSSGTSGDSGGLLWLDRPGRLRVQYMHPPKLLLANNGRLLLADQDTGATTTMPVSNTPLNILLADDIELSGAVTIAGVRREGDALRLVLVQTAAPQEGSLTLTFATAPIALRGVVVRDGSGHIASLSLDQVVLDKTTDPNLFRYEPPPPSAG
jgi:outer membrane lipoprotein-sorting protein